MMLYTVASMLYVAEDSLPDGIDEVTITMKHGFNIPVNLMPATSSRSR